MKPRFLAALTAALLAIVAFAALPAHADAQDNRAKAILDKIDDLYRSDSSESTMEMTVRTEHYKRTLVMEGWSKGKDKSLFRILSPLKEKGTTTLKSGKHVYTYLPKTDRTIRLSAGMMQGSWMGSHFTNDDLVRESRLAEDYTWKITFEGERDGQKVIEITLTAKEDAAVAWARVVLTVSASEDLQPLSQRYYDEDGHLERTMKFEDVKELGGRRLPTKMVMIPADKPDEFTEVVYKKARFDLELSDSIFSKNRLER